MGKKQFNNGYYEKSAIFLEEFLERNPQHREASLIFFKSLINSNDLDKAFSILSKMEINFPDLSTVQIMKGFYLLKKGRISDLENLIQALDQNQIDQSDLWLLKADFYSQKNQNSMALLFFKKYINQFPGEPTIYIKMITYYIHQNDFENASNYLKKFKELFPENIEYYRLIGDYYLGFYLKQLSEISFLKKNEITDLLKQSLLYYKTYYNYNDSNYDVLNQILYISYLLNEKFDFENFLQFTKDPIYKANYYQHANLENLESILRNNCEKKEYLLSCFRYDLFLLEKQMKKQLFKRMKYYSTKVSGFENTLPKREKLNYYLWAEKLYSGDVQYLENRIQFYKTSGYYEDYFLDLYEASRQESNPQLKARSKISMEKFLQQKDQYLPLRAFPDVFPLVIKDALEREKKEIFIFTPFPIEKQEKHFLESEILRNLLNQLVNFVEYFKVVEDAEWKDIKKRFVKNHTHYFFFNPEIPLILEEWEREKNRTIHYLLESYYKIYHNHIYLNLILRNKKGIVLQSKEFYLKNLDDDIRLASTVQNFLLESMPLEGKFLKNIENKFLINLGEVDGIKKDQIFFYKGSYYKVSEVYPYISLLEFLKGNKNLPEKKEIFVRVSKN